MPALVRLYIRQCAVGFALAAVFVALLFAFNVANLWHLVTHSDVGVLASMMLFLANGIVFAGVQFGISVMRMSDNGTPPDQDASGKLPLPVTIEARSPRLRH